jgi:hypothetical protein
VFIQIRQDGKLDLGPGLDLDDSLDGLFGAWIAADFGQHPVMLVLRFRL